MKNRILVYDDACPLCTWYSGLFVKYRFLEADGRKAFSTLDDKLLSLIDFNKSRNEIPLLDTSSNKVLYGIDALLEILDQKIPHKNYREPATRKMVVKKILQTYFVQQESDRSKKMGTRQY